MLIGIDGNEANIQKRVGTGQYSYQLLVALSRLDTKNCYLIYLKDPPSGDMPKSSPTWKYHVFGPKKMWTRFALPIQLYFGTRPDIFFSPSHYLPLISPVPTVCSIMDLGFLHYPQQLTQKDLYQLTAWTAASIKQAKHVITISQFTKQEIVDTYHYPALRISVVYPGVSPPKKIMTDASLPANFFLSLGTLKPSKNIPFLIEAFSSFSQKNPSYKLMIVGKKGWLYDQIFATVKQYNLMDKIIFQDYITEYQKWPLLKQAKALIIPSLYEGFGIPAIEAMAVGTPVIASTSASLLEIVKNYGLLIDPHHPSELTQALSTIILSKSQEKYRKLGYKRAKDFSWNASAQILIDLFNQV